MLSDGGKICVRCVASDAGVPTSELPPYVQIVASSILITMDRGRCRLCGREDTRLSFGETSRWAGGRGSVTVASSSGTQRAGGPMEVIGIRGSHRHPDCSI